MIRTKKKINKMRGSRSIGGGCSKKRRGAGNRGGKGKAGLHKHHWSWTVKFDPDHFGKKGFKRPIRSIKKSNPINLDYLEEHSERFIENGLATVEDGKIIIDVTDLGYDKVLGKGKISKSLIVKSPAFSGLAEKKIVEAGGEAIIL